MLYFVLGIVLIVGGLWIWVRSIPSPGESVRVSWSERSRKRLPEGGSRIIFILVLFGLVLIAKALGT